MSQRFKNIPLKVFQNYLVYKGLKKIRTKGGHEVWSRKDLLRPVILQSHISPVPEFIIKNSLRNIGEKPSDFQEFLKKK